MKKRVLSLFLAFTLSLSLLPSGVALAEESLNGTSVTQEETLGGNTPTTQEETLGENPSTTEQETQGETMPSTPPTSENALGETTPSTATQSAINLENGIALLSNDPVKPENGDGSESNPYQISNAEELAWFRDQVNSGQNEICARLTADITLSNEEWEPIGKDQSHWYLGTFDGSYHTISNINLVTSRDTPSELKGLFGYIGGYGCPKSGIVKRLSVEADELGTGTAGLSKSGLLAAVNYGEISLCYAQIRKIANNVSEFGILVYSNIDTIENCLSLISGTNSTTAISGLVYTNTGKINSCYFKSSAFGYANNYAIVAKDSSSDHGNISNCYYWSTMSANKFKDDDDTHIAAIYNNADVTSGKIVWLLNNGKDGTGNKISPWRHHSTGPKLDPTLPAVTKDTNGNFIIGNKPHTHRDDNGNIIEFTEISNLSQIDNSLTSDTNYFCLSDNIELNSTWEVPYTKNIVLCMNGHDITKGASFNADTAISTNETKDLRKKLTLTNCNDNAGGSISGFIKENEIAITHKGGYLTLSGNTKVTGNKKNILLEGGHYITLRDLNENARFGISVDGQDNLSPENTNGLPVTNFETISAQYLGNLYAEDFDPNGENGFDLFVNDQQYIRLRKQTPHKHCICGGAISNEGHSNHDTPDTLFLPWKETNSLPDTAGNYYLTRDVKLTKQWTPSRTFNICLNGFSITTSDEVDANVTSINLDQTDDVLTLTDCNTEEKQGTISFIYYKHKSKNAIRLSGGATFNLYGGTIKDYRQSAVYVTNGTFNMYGGTLTNNTNSNAGPAVYCEGSSAFNMYSGKITGNSTDKDATSHGGGVYIGANTAFTMKGGEITNNTASGYGGGVYIAKDATSYSISNATITGNTAGANCLGGGIYASVGGMISNSTISNNQAKSGGGIYSSGVLTIDDSEIYNNTTIADGSTTGDIRDALGGGIYSNNSLTISNTTISGNTATGEGGRNGIGGGIYANRKTTFNDGTIIQSNTASTAAGGVYRPSSLSASVDNSFHISGKINITDNTVSTEKSNLYFDSSTITNPIIVDSELNKQTSIGVTVNGVTADNIPLNIATVDESSNGDLNWLNKNYFTSDNSDYITLMSENNKFIQLGKHKHNWKYECIADYATVLMTCTDPECDSPDGGKLTIQEPTLKIYNGQNATGAEATLTEVDWKGATTADLAPTITYTNKQNGTNLGNTAPTNAGEYIARVSVGNKMIYVDYTIQPKEVTVTGISVSDKSYDGTTVATIHDSSNAQIDGLVDPTNDKVTVDSSKAIATFADKNVGTDKPVTITGVELTSDDASNYKLSVQPTAKADITTRKLQINSVTIQDKEYDKTNAATIGKIDYAGIIDGDDVSLELTATFESADAGEGKTVSLSGGTLLGSDKNNYTFNDPLPIDCKATIRKATPTGAPKYTAITESGKTISGAALTTEGGTFNVPGTVAWVDDNSNPLPGSTIVETGKLYKWLFTPTDSNNYNTLSGSIELYHKQDSGSTGGGTTGGGGSTSGGGAIGGGGSTGGGSTGGGTQYTIDVIKGAHGSSSSGDISVSQGNDHTFTFTPNKGYTIFDVKIDGKSIGAVDTYTFENIDANHTIEVIFVKSPTHQIAIPILGRFTQYYLQSMIHNLYRNIIFLHRLSA